MYSGNLQPITNRQDWSDTFTCVVVVDGLNVPVDVSAAIFEIFVRHPKTCKFDLQGKTGDGSHFTLPAGGTDGVVKWTFTDDEVRTLCGPLTYDVGLYITQLGIRTPIALLKLPVYDGVAP